MAKAIEYLSEARVDFDEAFDWYAQRSVGAAIGFVSSVGRVAGVEMRGTSIEPPDGNHWGVTTRCSWLTPSHPEVE